MKRWRSASHLVALALAVRTLIARLIWRSVVVTSVEMSGFMGTALEGAVQVSFVCHMACAQTTGVVL